MADRKRVNCELTAILDIPNDNNGTTWMTAVLCSAERNMDRTILTWAKHFRRLIKAAGPLAGTNILCREIFRIPKPITVSVGGYSLTLRPDNSDPSVAGKIFGAHEYDIGEQKESPQRFSL